MMLNLTVGGGRHRPRRCPHGSALCRAGEAGDEYGSAMAKPDGIFSAKPMAHWRAVFDKAVKDPHENGIVVPLEVPGES